MRQYSYHSIFTVGLLIITLGYTIESRDHTITTSTTGTSSPYASGVDSDVSSCDMLFGTQAYAIIDGGGECTETCGVDYVSITSDIGYLPPENDQNTGNGLDDLDLCVNPNLQCCVSKLG